MGEKKEEEVDETALTTSAQYTTEESLSSLTD